MIASHSLLEHPMTGRFALIVALTVFLSACVLSSKKPMLAADEGAMPIADGAIYDPWSKNSEGWKKEDPPFNFKAGDKTYLLSDGKSVVSLLFVKLDADWYALQYHEKPEQFYYGLVRMTAAGEIEVVPLPCDKIKAVAGSTPGIQFADNDCSIDGVADPKALFISLIGKLPEPDMKLVPRK